MSIILIELILTKSKLDSDNKDKIYCDDDGEYRIYCHVCDNLAIDRYYNIHLKSQAHIKNFRKRQRLKNSTSFSTTNNALDFEKIVSFNNGHKRPSCYFEVSHFFVFIYKFIRQEVE